MHLFFASRISLFMVGSSLLVCDIPTGELMTTVWAMELCAGAVWIWYVCISPPAPGSGEVGYKF